VITGDLSADGRPSELDGVARELARFGQVPRVVIPGNRDLERSVGPPGESRALPVDSDLDFFLALEPALTLGFDDGADALDTDPESAWVSRFGSTAVHRGADVHIVGVTTTPRLRSEALERAARQLRRAAPGALRVLALHHGLLPVPGRKLRDGDLTNRAGDVLALLTDLQVDLALHGHIHRANAWHLSDGRGSLVVASAGALVNDGRRDASYLEVDIERGRLAVWRRSVSTGRPTLLYEGARATPR
jgi:3',5'-cyclic AMP phosphodiesterase CpdA